MLNTSENYENIIKTRSEDYVQKYRLSAEKYAKHAMDKESIMELLQIDGCDTELSKELADMIIKKMPKDFYKGVPPHSFFDVKDKTKDSLENGPIFDIQEYVENSTTDLAVAKNIMDNIKIARSERSSKLIQEILNTLEPLLDNSISSKMAMANSGIKIETSRKDELERDLFGVWPVEIIQSYLNNESVRKGIYNKSKSEISKIIWE